MLLVLGALLALVLVVFRSGLWTSAILLVVWLLTVALRDSVDLSVSVSGVRVTALDMMSLILIMVGVSRLATGGVTTLGRGLALVLVLLLVIHVARGASDFGVQSSVNHARSWIYFASGLIYAATCPTGWDRRVWRLLAAFGLLAGAIAVPYLLLDGVHPATELVYRDGVWVTNRPLTASGALLVLQAAVVTFGLAKRRSTLGAWAVLAAVGVLVALEHRTIWVAGIACAVVGFLWWSSRRLRLGDSTPIGVAGVVLVLLPLAAWAFARTGTLISSAKEVTNSNSTFAWRTTSWNELIAKHHDASQFFGGAPSGADWSRIVNGISVDLSPHDGFVDAYLRFGVPGVVVISVLGFLLWRKRDTIGANVGGLPAEVVGLLVLTQAVFSVAYTLDCVQGLIAGILVSGLAVERTSDATAASRPHPAALAVHRTGRAEAGV
jgi:hypothetical protein